MGGSFNPTTGQYTPHGITRASTEDLRNGLEGILATAKTPVGRPTAQLTNDTRVTIAGCEMRLEQAVQAGLITRTQAGHFVEPAASLQIAPQAVQVDPVDASLATLEGRLGPAISTRIVETVLRRGSLDSIDPQDYAYAGITREQFEALAAPAFSRTAARIEAACDGEFFADQLHGWCQRDPERQREYDMAAREIHHLGDDRRMRTLMQKWYAA